MSWAVERDKFGSPIRMWWMGKPDIKRQPPMVTPGCQRCGYHFGWHTMECLRTNAGAEHK
jgi:hypothetical protein